MNELITAFERLKQYIEKEKFKGYDPYDTLLSWVPFTFLGKWISFIVIQLQKRNPINLRPILGIKKSYNPKGLGVLLQAYSLIYLKYGKQIYKNNADFLFQLLKTNYTRGYSGYCWGYNFPYTSTLKALPPYMPSTVVSGFVIRGIWEYYKITHNDEAAEIIQSSAKFILNDLPISNFENGICISYTPLEDELCYNASLLGAEILARAHHFNFKQELKEKAVSAVQWVISHQKLDGHWNYRIDPKTSIEKRQIDFHQGYVIDSIYEIKKLLNIDEKIWENAIIKGLDFYKNNQFFENGQSLWRLPKEFPVDIHNQSQGIIMFSKFTSYNDEYKAFARKIAQYTINQMQSPKGYFYYRKYKLYKHKIPYMRWSQAWMFLALSRLFCSD